MTSAMAAAIPGVFLPQARAQAGKNTLTIGMPLEPPGLDPTTGAASAIAEITQYNIFETLTKVNADGSVTPMLAESWTSSPDMKTFVFKLRKGVRFENGQPFNASVVKFSFDRAGGAKSTNKDKRFFSEIGTVVLDEYTVGVNSTLAKALMLFLSAFMTGMMGAFNAHYINFLEPDYAFSGLWTMPPIVAAIFGGYRTITGPLIGAVVVYLLDQLVFKAMMPIGHQIVLGALLGAMILFAPQGLQSIFARRLPRLRMTSASGDA